MQSHMVKGESTQPTVEDQASADLGRIPEGRPCSPSGDFTSHSLKEVIMSLEDALSEYRQPTVVKEEPATDGLARGEADVEERGSGDEGESGEGNQSWEGHDESMDGSGVYDLRVKRTRTPAGPQKGQKKFHRTLWNMTYTHEQRIKMGYYAAKWGMTAMKEKYRGVKDSTGRDMLKFVLALVRKKVLSLDLPLEEQVIPPKTRKGAPILPVYLSRAKRDDSVSSVTHTSLPDDDELDQAFVSAKRQCSGGMDSPPHTETPKQPATLEERESTTSAAFEDRVRIGFLAVAQGPGAAMKQHGASETVVRECRNTVVHLAQSGLLSLEVPLEEQDMPADPEKTAPGAPAAASAKLRRCPVSRHLPLPQPTSSAGSYSRMTTTRQNSISNPQEDRTSDAGPNNNLPLQIHRASADDPGPESTRAAAISKDISLGTDLAFLRWRNRRTSLGFQSDQAFAMHLMDVHDAFCADQCNGGGRLEGGTDASVPK